MRQPDERGAHLRALAERLEFTVEKTGGRFTLTRVSSASRPVREGGRTLERAEQLLNDWKLRGFHGG